jgi:hypothetical protein
MLSAITAEWCPGWRGIRKPLALKLPMTKEETIAKWKSAA